MKNKVLYTIVIIFMVLTIKLNADESLKETTDVQLISIVNSIKNQNLIELKNNKNLKKYINEWYVKKNLDGSFSSVTILTLACQYCDLSVVKYLIDQGADIYKQNLINVAIEQNNYPVASFVISKFSIEYLNKLLVLSVDKNCDVKYIELMLRNKTDPNYIYYNLSPLSASKSIQVSKLLIDYGAKINPKLSDKLFYSPLHMAIKNGYYKLAKYLIDNGANINEQDYKNNCSSLMLVMRGELISDQSYLNYENLYFAEELIKKGANVNLTNSEGFTALHYACSFHKMSNDIGIRNYNMLYDSDNVLNKSSYLSSDAVEAYLNIIKLLLKNGADINSKSKQGIRPIHFACKAGSYQLVTSLIQNGAVINDTTDPLSTIWCSLIGVNNYSQYSDRNYVSCISPERIEIVKLLIQNKADLNYRLNVYNGASLLHLVVPYNNIELIDILLKNGIDINNVDNNGDTPLNLAILNNQVFMVNYLLEHGASKVIKNKFGFNSFDMAKNLNNNEILMILNEIQ